MTTKKIIHWGCEYLLSQGYILKNNLPEDVKITPWSYVARFATSAGYVYLKHTPNLLALEADITQILQSQFHAGVPEIIANNAELNCFLMKDAGSPLREILKNKFDAALLIKAIDQFTSMQLAVADRVDVFLDIGVPDWRLDKLTELFKQLLTQKELLIADGLSEVEISKLENLLPMISNLCKKLSEYPIQQTLVQPDFHDNNILVDLKSQKITFIDLGEIVISHPFFSLLTCLQQIKKHHGLTDEDDVFQKIMNACLKNFMNIDSKNNLLEAFTIAKILLFVYGALAYERLMQACGKEKIMLFQHGRLGSELKQLIVECTNVK